MAIERIVGVPEVVPDVVILWINAKSLAVRVNCVGVAIEVIVSKPEGVPSPDIFRYGHGPFFAPLQQFLPILALLQNIGAFKPVHLAAPAIHLLRSRLYPRYPLHWHRKIETLSAIDVQRGETN